MIQLFSGVATALERHKIRMRSVLDRGATRVESALGREVTRVERRWIRMKNWYRLRVPRSRRPGARWIMSKLAGIDRIPSLEKRLSQCGDDAMRACRCFPRSTAFQANKIKRPRPHATESRRFLPESDVGLAQPSHRSAQACGPWGVMPVAAGSWSQSPARSWVVGRTAHLRAP